ncbi:MAG: Uma2 family endonuclease [Akkermansiaceae bacterium]|nr:Uma2 family endonuclease [Armatimonadota bacterium]
MRNFEQHSRELDEAGYRLEWVNGLAVVEASPVMRHQQIIFRIESSIRPDTLGDAPCQCIHAADVNIRFPDGSRKRPDIAIWCREPDEQDTEVTLLPEAVVEIISKDYAAKDLVIGVPFYQRIGIPDIIVLDPETNTVRHWRNGGNETSYPSPVTLDLQCGCTITV